MFGKRTKLICAKARELLFAGENYITLILATIIFAVSVILPFVAYYMAYGLVDITFLLIAFLGIEFLFSLPLLWGMVRIAGKASQKEDVMLIDVFFAFGSLKNYFKVFLLSLIRILGLTTPAAVGYILAYAVAYIFALHAPATLWLFVIFIAISYALLLPFMLRLYMIDLLVAADDKKILESIKLSWHYTRNNAGFLIVLLIKTIPLLIVSIVAVCVPLVIYTLPFLFCAYSFTCRKLMQIPKQNDICSVDITADVEEINEQDS